MARAATTSDVFNAIAEPHPSVEACAAAPAAPLIPVASAPAEPKRYVTVDLATSKATAEESSGASSAASASAPGASAAAPAPGPASAEEHARAAGPPVAAPPPTGPPTITTLRAQQPDGSPADTAVVQHPRTTREGAAVIPAAGIPPAAAAPPESTHHAWAVQLGSFASKANADTLVRRLRAEISPAYVSPTGTGPSLRYRVRVGPLADRAPAERAMVKLKKEGHPATLVAP